MPPFTPFHSQEDRDEGATLSCKDVLLCSFHSQSGEYLLFRGSPSHRSIHRKTGAKSPLYPVKTCSFAPFTHRKASSASPLRFPMPPFTPFHSQEDRDQGTTLSCKDVLVCSVHSQEGEFSTPPLHTVPFTGRLGPRRPRWRRWARWSRWTCCARRAKSTTCSSTDASGCLQRHRDGPRYDIYRITYTYIHVYIYIYIYVYIHIHIYMYICSC